MYTYDLFTPKLRSLFQDLVPLYLGTAHESSGDKIRIKTDGTPVSNLDTHVQGLLRRFISERFPGDITIAEEDKRDEKKLQAILANQNQFQWTIDGLDGTGNRRMGSHSYGAMVARRYGREIDYAAIFRPVDEKLYGNGFYYASRIGGAWQWCSDCNNTHNLKTAAPGELERVNVMLEGSSKKFFLVEVIEGESKKFVGSPIAFLGTFITTRPSCSSSIAATTVALGKASAFVTRGNKPWDNWPAWLLIKEAGGIVTDHNGNPPVPENCGDIVAAANEADHAAILKALAIGKEK